MKNTLFKVEDVFGDVISKNCIPPEQITKHNNILAEVMWIVNLRFCMKINFFKTRKKNIGNQGSAPL